MRTSVWVVLSMVIGTVAAGCQGADSGQSTVVVEEEPVVGVTWEQYRDWARMAAGGGDHFIAEWDLYFATEQDLRAHYDAIVAADKEKLHVFKQISTGFEPTFSVTKAVSLIYCVSNSFSNKARAVSDMASAALDWQTAANVYLRYDSTQDGACDQNNGAVDFAVMPTSVSGLAGCGANKMLWSAAGGCPVSGNNAARGVLLVNYGVFPLPSPSDGVTTVGDIRHELGHMLGFRHEHPWAPSQGGCAEAPTISSADTTGRQLTVTAYDQKSVMHYPQCNGIAHADLTLSLVDGDGARMVYNLPTTLYSPLGLL
jgi:hypothetical protein